MWRSLTQYHPKIGYTFIPGIKSRVPHESGGYLLRANGAGFRCDHELAHERPTGKRRALLFGDSQTAGDGVSNGERYGDVLEKLLPGLEVLNFGLPGTGTDQQYLAYQELAPGLEHDLLILGVHVENIGRVANRYRPYTDENEREVIYAKPYYELQGGRLVLGHVPVPRAPVERDAMSAEDARHVDWGLPFASVRKLVKKLGVRDLVQKLTHFQPVPDYDSADNPKWVLMRAILEDWIRASKTPTLLVPIPLFTFVEGSSDPGPYQARFRELAAATGCVLHDPLPDMKACGEAERRGFRFQTDVHFTPAGHAALARSLRPSVERLLGANGASA